MRRCQTTPYNMTCHSVTSLDISPGHQEFTEPLETPSKELDGIDTSTLVGEETEYLGQLQTKILKTLQIK